MLNTFGTQKILQMTCRMSKMYSSDTKGRHV